MPKTFAELGLSESTLKALSDVGYESPSPIQEQAIPSVLEGRDVIGQAQTGTGKTAAFGLPIAEYIDPEVSEVQALVLTPTRELCIQVTQALRTYGAHKGIDVVAVFGGAPIRTQQAQLRAGGHVVVGTVGRVLDLISRHSLVLHDCRFVVLDEADEMLDLGFLPDIERILRQIPVDRQAMLFSATMPDPIITLARTFMNQPTHIRAEAPHSSAIHATTEQFVYRAHALDKVELVTRLLQVRGRGATMVFTRTKRTAQKVADDLAERGFKVGAVHGDLGQAAREKALNAFRAGDIDVLVATDVAARGIDIDDVTHVINYQCPEDEKVYVHRIGRTGRAGRAGVAITLVDWDELARWSTIDKALGLDCPAPAETYSSSPHLYLELDIPTDVTGRIGPAQKSPQRAPAQRRDGASATPTRNRSRQRTRGGKTGTGHVEAEAEKGAAEQDTADTPHAGRRRRRRRPRTAASNVG
jgi:superfamily II DNA/RNA helicase